MTYWSSGPGCWMLPLPSESGTLNSTICALEPVQWPAVRKQPVWSSMSHAEQPMGTMRPDRSSSERARSSTPSQMESASGSGGPTHARGDLRRLIAAPGSATISTSTEEPLKYALVCDH